MSNSFVRLARKDAVKPGAIARIIIQERAILLANVGGNFYAVDDLCTHEDAILSNGAIKGNCIECPLHGSQFDLRTGEPQQEPANSPLHTYHLDISEDAIYIALD